MLEQKKIKVVLDTNVFVSFLLTASPTISKILYLWEKQQISVYYSIETLNELKTALTYPKVKKYILQKDASNLLDHIKLKGVLVEAAIDMTGSRDLKDNKFIAVAISADTSYLITGDKDLLVLNTHSSTICIVSPNEFLQKPEVQALNPNE